MANNQSDRETGGSKPSGKNDSSPPAAQSDPKNEVKPQQVVRTDPKVEVKPQIIRFGYDPPKDGQREN